ncbi:DoxX family protein [Aliamphritea spongicola]|uniref:DoxX family protein n=1 Tax=Aliamphritea spongicola TaxID=707589 RepID=UPI00196AAF65|nr:hypothetical protein [Aliamphritea spongicola]MBN3562847.1 hypothetical protein [Aliamphritea spongicola]
MFMPKVSVYFVIRLLTCGIWLSAGLHKLFNSGFHIKGIELHGMAFAATAIFVVVLLIEVGGSSLVLFNKYVWAVCIIWIGFLFPASVLYHTGWIPEFLAENFVGSPPGFTPFSSMVAFFKNVSIAGGLIALIYFDQSKPLWLRNLLERSGTE